MLSGKQSPASAEIGPLGPVFFHFEHLELCARPHGTRAVAKSPDKMKRACCQRISGLACNSLPMCDKLVKETIVRQERSRGHPKFEEGDVRDRITEALRG